MKYQGFGIGEEMTSGVLLCEKTFDVQYHKAVFNKEQEAKLFLSAYDGLRKKLLNLIEQTEQQYGKVAGSIVSGYLTLLQNSNLKTKIYDIIINKNICAVPAVQQVFLDYKKCFYDTEDTYLWARCKDLEEIENYLIKIIIKPKTDIRSYIKSLKRSDHNYVYYANHMGILSFLCLPSNIKGIILTEDCQESHLCILTQIKKCPLIIGVSSDIIGEQNKMVTMNAQTGEIIVE